MVTKQRGLPGGDSENVLNGIVSHGGSIRGDAIVEGEAGVHVLLSYAADAASDVLLEAN